MNEQKRMWKTTRKMKKKNGILTTKIYGNTEIGRPRTPFMKRIIDDTRKTTCKGIKSICDGWGRVKCHRSY